MEGSTRNKIKAITEQDAGQKISNHDASCVHIGKRRTLRLRAIPISRRELFPPQRLPPGPEKGHHSHGPQRSEKMRRTARARRRRSASLQRRAPPKPWGRCINNSRRLGRGQASGCCCSASPAGSAQRRCSRELSATRSCSRAFERRSGHQKTGPLHIREETLQKRNGAPCIDVVLVPPSTRNTA